MSYEYKVVPAPQRGLKAKGKKTHEDRFAHALETAMNAYAADGWEYLRADTLPCEQREGLMGRSTVFQNILVFRRPAKAKQLAPAPVVPAPQPQLTADRHKDPLMIEKPVITDNPDVPETEEPKAETAEK